MAEAAPQESAPDSTAAPDDPLIEALRGLLGERLSTARAVREHHGDDLSFHAMAAPDAVAFAQTTEEVAAIMKFCAEHSRPVVPFGAGTSLEGQIQAPEGGVCIDLSGMQQVLEVNQADLDCRVQAGVTRKALNHHLRDTGLFFPIDPGADASLGGMAATSASGTNAVRYGTMRENVMGLTVVLADGRIIRTGGRSRKSSAGYDLTRLFVGSEGTLGIITEVQLRLYGIPEAMTAGVCSFETLAGAVDAVILTIQSGIPVARIELLDEHQVDAVNRYAKLDLPLKPTLFYEFHGTETWASEQAELAGEIAEGFGGANFQWATKQEDRNKLWQARHDVWFANLALKPGAKGWATDVCVPISRLAECILETRKDIDETGVLAPIVGHVGDGNFHLSFILDPNAPEELEKAEAVNERMVMRALSMGGTCTGEHGVGSSKKKFLQAEHGEAVSVMRQLKLALDPQNLMNPGKILTV
ncbi:FAD-binding protein [Pelagibius litoralis]|uniref:D-lactate dehydrogenase (cytochrome) n=1 Tax=Pelagibius litoralis TaxID=374515 RepID=A0A967EWV6_9PROT|nr:FAD-linked oxidase C-terminal domain-containing protein [Pelagibius litoralis]NIA68583.1 FAD-binding protein [Pelagibius litoralis]